MGLTWAFTWAWSRHWPFCRRPACGSGRRPVPCSAGTHSRPAGSRAAASCGRTAAPSQQPPSNPVCVRLEGQLAALNRGGGDPARAEQIKRYEDAAAKQQADLDRLVAQAKRRGCEGGFFSLFTGQSPECQPLNAQIQQMRDNLDRTMSDLERLKSGNNYDQEGQRRVLLGELAQNNCGPQYRAAAAAAGPSGFLDALFGGAARIINPGGDGAPSGTFRTVCVRSCDGYYFPISYSTVQSRFADDQRTCQRECPGDRGAALHLSQSRRGHRPSGFARRPALHRVADRVPISQGIQRGLLVPAAGPELGRCAQGRRRFHRRSKAATSSSPTRTPRRSRSRRCRKAPSRPNPAHAAAHARRGGGHARRHRGQHRSRSRRKAPCARVGPPFVAAH